MTVKELIRQLQCFDGDLSVVAILGNENKQSIVLQVVFDDMKCIIELED